jgi:hypothetical protein
LQIDLLVGRQNRVRETLSGETPASRTSAAETTMAKAVTGPRIGWRQTSVRRCAPHGSIVDPAQSAPIRERLAWLPVG